MGYYEWDKIVQNFSDNELKIIYKEKSKEPKEKVVAVIDELIKRKLINSKEKQLVQLNDETFKFDIKDIYYKLFKKINLETELSMAVDGVFNMIKIIIIIALFFVLLSILSAVALYLGFEINQDDGFYFEKEYISLINIVIAFVILKLFVPKIKFLKLK